MIGIFDSGIGGLSSLREYTRLVPEESIIYLADRQNAPYGTKDRDTVIRLTKKNIRTLKDMGAERILIACCTASSVYGELTLEEQSIAFPIIPPTVRTAIGFGKRIGVIATRRTVSSHAFMNEISAIDPRKETVEIAAQELVEMVEDGARDGKLCPRHTDLLDSLCRKIKGEMPDCLILGCTHFSYLEGEIASRIAPIPTVNSARVGAVAMAETRGQSQKDRQRIITFIG